MDRLGWLRLAQPYQAGLRAGPAGISGIPAYQLTSPLAQPATQSWYCTFLWCISFKDCIQFTTHAHTAHNNILRCSTKQIFHILIYFTLVCYYLYKYTRSLCTISCYIHTHTHACILFLSSQHTHTHTQTLFMRTKFKSWDIFTKMF